MITTIRMSGTLAMSDTMVSGQLNGDCSRASNPNTGSGHGRGYVILDGSDAGVCVAGGSVSGGGLHSVAMATDLDTESMYWSKEDCAKLFKREIVHRELITSFGQDISKVGVIFVYLNYSYISINIKL